MSLAPALGRWQYLRGKSQWYLETVRAWITPAAAAGAFAKYLGVPSRWSVAVAVLVPLVVEVVGFLLGRYLWERGGVEAEYQMALDRDPWKRQSLELADRTTRDLRAIRIIALGIHALLTKRPEPPAK